MTFTTYFLALLLCYLNLFSTSRIRADDMPSNSIHIHCYKNESVKKMRSLLDEWAIDQFMSFPYLYVYQEETDYNTIFEIDPDSFVLSAEQETQVLGLLQATTLNSRFLQNECYTPYPVLDNIQAKGFNPDNILYISSFLIAKSERNNISMIRDMFEKARELAKKTGKTKICYMAEIPKEHHPLKPQPYIPLEPWEDLNVTFKPMNVQIDITWPTLQIDGSVKQENHVLDLFVTDS